MIKKVAKKIPSVKNKEIATITTKRILKKNTEPKIEKVLIENFVSLQKVMTNLSIKFDNLTKQISKLLELFEISAKALAEKNFDLERGSKNKKIVEKIDTLLDQNKIIARGLTLMHEKIPEQKSDYPPIQAPQQIQQQVPKPQVKTQEYQKSISSTTAEEYPSTQLPPK